MTNTLTTIELEEIVSLIENVVTFYAMSKTVANEITEALEDIGHEFMMVTEAEGKVFAISSAIKQTISVEDYTEEGEGFDVTLNTYYHDENGKQIDYESNVLKNFKTEKGEVNFAKKKGWTIVEI